MRRVSAYLRVLALFFSISCSYPPSMTRGTYKFSRANAYPTICLHNLKAGPPPKRRFIKPGWHVGSASVMSLGFLI